MIVKVSVFAGAKKEELIEKRGGEFDVFVKEPPLQNMANRKVLNLIANYFKVPVGGVKILTGHKSPKKRIEINTEQNIDLV